MMASFGGRMVAVAARACFFFVLQGEETLVLMTPIAAEKFIKTLYDDYLPSCEAEERIWGLVGGCCR